MTESAANDLAPRHGPEGPPLREVGLANAFGLALGPAFALLTIAGAALSGGSPEVGLGIMAAAGSATLVWAAIWPWWPPKNPQLALSAIPLAMGLRLFGALGGGWIVADWAGMPQSHKFWLTLTAVFLITLAAETIWLASAQRGHGKAKNSAEG